jgi:hypothetical protein
MILIIGMHLRKNRGFLPSKWLIQKHAEYVRNSKKL